MTPRRIQRNAREDSLLVNMRPSHPAMHGAVRIMLELDGEKILNSEVEVGSLHRGFEKTCESRTYFILLIYTDRLNYVSPLINNHGYALAMETLLGIEAPERARLIRVLLAELSRISDHVTCLAAMVMECGAFTAFLYQMKAREFLWDVIEQTTGARMTTSFIRWRWPSSSAWSLTAPPGTLSSHIKERNAQGMNYVEGKHILGRALLLEPTWNNIAALGLLVVRTILSWTLVVEIERHWPWRAGQNSAEAGEHTK